MWRGCCSCLGRRGSGSTRYSGGLVARAAGNIVLQKGMTTSIGRYAPVFLPGEALSLTENPGRPQSIGLQSRTRLKRPCAHRCKTFFACVISAPVRVEREGGTASWLAGTLAVPSVQGQGLPLQQDLCPIGVFFQAS